MVTGERALAEADAMDAMTRAGHWQGPLHGIPYALKDLFDARETLTTWGAEPFQERIAAGDAAVVTRLRQAGRRVARQVDRRCSRPMATSGSAARPRNPWNLNEGASGSSAGSAAATAAGLCAFSIGTETLGSITLALGTLRHDGA